MEVKLPEEMEEGFWEEFCPLLNEGGSRRDFIRQEIKILHQFIIDAVAFHTEEKMNQLDKPQLAVTGKILLGIFNELGSITGHVVHNCPECGFDLLRE